MATSTFVPENQNIVDNDKTFATNIALILNSEADSARNTLFQRDSTQNTTPSFKNSTAKNNISANEKFEEHIIQNFSHLRQVPFAKNFTKKTQKWLGHVTSVGEATFTAELTDLINGGTIEIGEFDLDEISEEDKTLLNVGSAFYWSLGYYIENGQVRKTSFMRFQRLLLWSEEDFDLATDTANRQFEKINWL